jgi:hypothetical protein
VRDRTAESGGKWTKRGENKERRKIKPRKKGKEKNQEKK